MEMKAGAPSSDKGRRRAERRGWYTDRCILWFCIMGSMIVGITVLALANIALTELADPVHLFEVAASSEVIVSPCFRYTFPAFS